MKLIIPMAGQKKSFRSNVIGKNISLFKLGGKVVLSHILGRLKGLKFDEIIFIIDKEDIFLSDFIKSNFKSKKVSFVYQESRKGVGDAIFLCKKFFKNGEEVFILFADTLIEANFKDFRKGLHDGVIWTKEVKDPREFGVVYLDGEHISRFIEKPVIPDTNKAIVGMYYFKSSKPLFKALNHIISNNIKSRDEFQLTDALQVMVNNGAKLIANEVNVWKDCSSFSDILDINKSVLDDVVIKSVNPKSSVIIKPCFISEGAVIKNSVIGPYVSIGSDCVIDNSIISNSVIGDDSKISDANLNDSLIGDYCVIKGDPVSFNLGDNSSVSFRR